MKRFQLGCCPARSRSEFIVNLAVNNGLGRVSQAGIVEVNSVTNTESSEAEHNSSVFPKELHQCTSDKNATSESTNYNRTSRTSRTNEESRIGNGNFVAGKQMTFGLSCNLKGHGTENVLMQSHSLSDENIVHVSDVDVALNVDIIDSLGYDSDKDPEYLPSDADDDSSEIDESRKPHVPKTNNVAGNVFLQTNAAVTNEEPTYQTNNENNVPKTKKSRWRSPHPETWKINLHKNLKKSGQPYDSKNNKSMSPKIPGPVDCSKCMYNCSTNFSEESRMELCQEYTKADFTQQKEILLSNVKRNHTERKRKRTGEGVDKEWSYSYYFKKDGKETRVCKKFFLKTLCISNGPLKNAFAHISDLTGNYVGTDKRGRKTPPNKTSPFFIEKIKKHIESFPTKESHYCRKSTGKKYLDSLLSIRKLYELFVTECEEESLENIPNEGVYRHIFCTEYNLDFHRPKKDQCLICSRYESSKGEAKAQLVEEYQQHRIRRNDANLCKEEDKKRATMDNTFVSASFDLQRVLHIPCSNQSPLYYSRKLSAYNLTVYEAAPPNKAYCFAWTEINGNRGSCEIGTAVFMWLKTLPESVIHVSLFSDTCGGQNRNQHMAALFLYVADKLQFEIIEHKFMEKGHSHMEVDSMHSAIEYAQKNVPVYIMRDWLNIFLMARSNRKYYKSKRSSGYVVKEIQYNEFLDLKALSQLLIKNRNCDSEGQKVDWLRIKRLCFKKSSPGIIFFSYDHTSEYRELQTIPKSRGRPVKPTLGQLYSERLSISEVKQKDLLKLCSSGVIPNEYHPWYQAIPSTTSKKDDRIPEPNIDEYFEDDVLDSVVGEDVLDTV